MNSVVAIFVSGFLTVVSTMTLAFDQQGFMFLNFATALVAILSTRSLRKRKEVFVVCVKAWVCAVASIFAIHFYQNTVWSLALLADIVCAAFFHVADSCISCWTFASS